MQIIVFKTLKSGKNLYLYMYRPSPTHMRYENISQLCQPLLGNQNENKN